MSMEGFLRRMSKKTGNANVWSIVGAPKRGAMRALIIHVCGHSPMVTSMENVYRNAKKKGQKYTRQQVVRGLYPKLPVLDEILPGNRQMTGKDLGLVQVPLEWVVGTVSSARAVSFAGNFMPTA